MYNKAYSMEDSIGVTQDSPDLYEGYLKHLNDVQQELVKRNPSGWEDDFEGRIEQHAGEAARRHGSHVRVEHDAEDGPTLHVYGTNAARAYGIIPITQRTPEEKAHRELQDKQFHEKIAEAAINGLSRSAKRMLDAGVHKDLLGDGSFTLDPDAEDPKDIYRPA